MLKQRTRHYNTRSLSNVVINRVTQMMQAVSDEKKASRHYRIDVTTHVESAVHVLSKITDTANKLDDDTFDFDADVSLCADVAAAQLIRNTRIPSCLDSAEVAVLPNRVERTIMRVSRS